MQTRKGLSDVIATVLLILLVLIAIFLIWFFVKPLLFRTDQVQDAGSCLTIRLSPVDCTYTRSDIGNATGGGRHALTTIRRDGDEGTINGFEMIFTNETGATRIIKDSAAKFSDGKSIKPGESRTYIFDIDTFVPKQLSIVALVGKTECAALISPLECVPYTGPTPCADVVSINSTVIVVNATYNRTDGGFIWIADTFINGIDKDGFDYFYEQYKNHAYYNSNLDFNKDSVINDQDYETFVEAFNIGGYANGLGNLNCPLNTG